VARTDAIVLGAGIVGTSVALHLAKRGLSVALVDRGAPGRATSYGNSGVIQGDDLFPPAFPGSLSALLRIALKRAPEANYHLKFLLRVLPWLLAFRANSSPEKLIETAHAMRPLFSHALSEHEFLLRETNALQYLRKTGWIKLYRKSESFAALDGEFGLAARYGIALDVLDPDGVQRLEPSVRPVFRKAVFWPGAASLSNPLAVTQAYAARFSALGGVILGGDAMTLHRADGHWRLDTESGALDAGEVVVALGPWTPDLLEPLGIKLPFGFKRGYHRHFRPQGNALLQRPVVDVDNGYLITPMEQGIRLTTGAEFAPRDAPPTPVQFDRIMPFVNQLFPLGERADNNTWLGARPCMPDSRPVIGRAPGQSGLWLAAGHAHWGLTLGPVTGRLIAEMMTGETPVIDPAPYRAERFMQSK
jgi:D-amino-acid dehydrogenase